MKKRQKAHFCEFWTLMEQFEAQITMGETNIRKLNPCVGAIRVGTDQGQKVNRDKFKKVTFLKVWG
jgi:phosphotransferase system IIB component